MNVFVNYKATATGSRCNKNNKQTGNGKQNNQIKKYKLKKYLEGVLRV